MGPGFPPVCPARWRNRTARALSLLSLKGRGQRRRPTTDHLTAAGTAHRDRSHARGCPNQGETHTHTHGRALSPFFSEHPIPPRAGSGVSERSPLPLSDSNPHGSGAFFPTLSESPRMGDSHRGSRAGPPNGEALRRGNGRDPQSRAPGQTTRSAPGAPQKAEPQRTRPMGGTRGTSGTAASPAAGEAQPTPHHHPREGGGQARGVSPTSRRPQPPLPPHAAGARREREGLEVGPDSAPLPSTHHPMGGVEERGAHGQNEKSGPIHHECPSLAWRSLGPAQESTHPPHRSHTETRIHGLRGDRDISEDSATEEPAFLPRRFHSHARKKSAEPKTTQQGNA